MTGAWPRFTAEQRRDNAWRLADDRYGQRSTIVHQARNAGGLTGMKLIGRPRPSRRKSSTAWCTTLTRINLKGDQCAVEQSS